MSTPPQNSLVNRSPALGSPFARKMRSMGSYLRQHWVLYLMLIPGLFFLFIYKLLPLWGLQIAFKNYKIFAAETPWKAIAESTWVGMKHFNKLFASSQFKVVLRNTLEINFMKILWLFPVPILCAILLNEIRHAFYQKLCQTLIYVPYFFSWVLIFGIFYSLLGSYGIVNTLIAAGGGERLNFFGDQSIFRSVLVFTEGWKEVGYNTVIYLAAITGIDQSLYEAATIDGCNRFQKIWYITLPGMINMIAIQFVLRVGAVMEGGFDQVFNLYTAPVYETGDIIDTYIYRLSFVKSTGINLGFTTAVGLFKNVVNFALLMLANTVTKALGQETVL